MEIESDGIWTIFGYGIQPMIVIDYSEMKFLLDFIVMGPTTKDFGKIRNRLLGG